VSENKAVPARDAQAPQSKLGEKTSGAGSSANEGEGNRSAARRFNEAQHKFVADGKVAAKAKEAEKAIAGPEGEELRRAEEIGKQHSHGEDPAVKR
jgi:hypothetical protein